jgi:energy-coupling factor transport system permease protein
MAGRAVIAWSAACVTVALLATDPAMRLLVLAATATVVVTSARRRTRPLLVAVAAGGLLSTAFNFLLSHVGATVLFALPTGWPAIGGPYTLEALVFGLVTGVTLAGAVLAVAPLSLVLEPHELLDALPSWLARTGAALQAALNLIPGLARSARAVADAQRLRGWRPGLRSLPEVGVPVLLTAIEDSIQLAEAMEARGFGSGPRTSYSERRWSRSDSAVLAAAAAALIAVLGLRVVGLLPDWQPYPTSSLVPAQPLALLAGVPLYLPALLWHRSRSSG